MKQVERQLPVSHFPIKKEVKGCVIRVVLILPCAVRYIHPVACSPGSELLENTQVSVIQLEQVQGPVVNHCKFTDLRACTD